MYWEMKPGAVDYAGFGEKDLQNDETGPECWQVTMNSRFPDLSVATLFFTKECFRAMFYRYFTYDGTDLPQEFPSILLLNKLASIRGRPATCWRGQATYCPDSITVGRKYVSRSKEGLRAS